MRVVTRNISLCVLLFVLACVGLNAQANSELTGIVTDQTGAVVPGAKLILTDPATGSTRTTESGATGLYDFNGLNPANYNMKVSAKGFEAYEQNGIVVNVSMTFRQDVKLTVGAESQTVTVSADSLTVQTDSNVVSTLISSEQISEIATENRNFAALAALGLGVSSMLPDNNTPTSVASNFQISVNGLRQGHNIWLIDGGEADDRGGAGGMDIMPSQDAIAEFNMLSSNYPPDYGISSGATMSLSLKSGTQKYHGELFEFNRNTVYDANSYFNKLSTPVTPRATVHYNIFGGNLGGPIFIPKTYNTNKQKSFFFVNEEWRKILNSAGTNVQHTIPAADLPVAGQDLAYVAPKFASSTQLVVPNVATSTWYYQNKLAPLGLTPNKPFPNNTIPHTLFDNNGVLYLNSAVFPKDNTSDDTNITNVSNPIDVLDSVVRIDHKFNDKWAILGHYMDDRVTQGYALPMLGWLSASYNTITSTLSNPSNSAAIKLSGTINPNLLVEGSFNYDGNVINITNSANSALPAGWNVSPVAPPFKITKNTLPGTGNMGPYGVSEDTGSAPWHNAARDYEPKLDVSYTMGQHAMKFGFSYNRYTKNQQIFGDEQGFYGPSKTTNDSLMDLLLGLTGNYAQFQATPIRHYVNQTPSVYAMDNWHVTPRLSLQLGLRYDALPHAWERNNAIGNFDPGAYNQSQIPIWTAAGTIDPTSPTVSTVKSAWAPPLEFYLNGMGLAGVNGFPRGLVNNKYNTLQPRVGFSEDLFGNGKTVLRGGFGTFFERTQGNDIYNAASNSPFAYNLQINNTQLSSPGANWQTGQNTAAEGLPVFVTGVVNLAPHNYDPPATAMYSLGVQHELSPSVVWVVQYVGNLAWHQWDTRQINNIPNTVGSVTIPQPGGGTATVAVACLSGDSGNKYGTSAADEGTYDANCKPGFQSFPGGQNQFLTYQGWANIKQQEMATNGTYNGFQTGVRIQNRWGLSGELDYTYSHEIDIQSNDATCCISNPWNLKYDKGSGAFDRRHMISANYVYKLPVFARSQGLEHALLGGWEVAGTVSDETGLPQIVTGAGGICCSGASWDPVGLGGGYTVRPNVSGKMSYSKKMSNFFNTSMFSNVTPQWLGGPNMGFGTAGKDAVVGPGRVNFTTSLYKSFAVTERAHFELRFESFNTFNHTEPNDLNTSFTPQSGPFSTVLNKGNTFGQVTTTYDPRVLELGGKFVF
ncbi:MAG TPA: carboxypeptidase regulatory-like domain-containing protein [Terracidiphilus sp.]|nr:carboxypeptidase regulatory-like domain-containing protein [Terracidiphilus sp.]